MLGIAFDLQNLGTKLRDIKLDFTVRLTTVGSGLKLECWYEIKAQQWLTTLVKVMT